MAYFVTQATDLADLAVRDRLRTLRLPMGIDFCSNDYLGFAASERLAGAVRAAVAAGVPVGSGGSRLLRGHHPSHAALEREAADWFGSEAALFFASGYAANVALFQALPRSGDLIVHDALIHASAHEGMRLGRATCVAARHNDATAFDDAIRQWRAGGGTGTPWIAVESLYSMDGDRAPLTDLAAIAAAHDAVLLIDEAHATGVFGAGGRGLAAAQAGDANVVVLRTCGKALGCEGALVCAPRVICDALVNRARGFIFSTAPSPLVAEAVRAAIRMLADESGRQRELHDRIALAERAFAPIGIAATGSPILPLVLGDDARTMHVARAVQAAGFDVRGIRPPSVPSGTARLRITITLNARAGDIAALGDALSAALA